MRKVLFILGQLSDEDVGWLTRVGRAIEVAAGRVIIRQGEMPREVFFVLQGRARVHAEGGPDVARIGVGEILGEMSMIDRRPPSVSVTSIEPTTLLAIDRDDLDEKLQTDLGFSARFHRAIALFLVDRLRASTVHVAYAAPDDEASTPGDKELDEAVLDNVHLAGIRFNMILERLSSVKSGAPISQPQVADFFKDAP